MDKQAYTNSIFEEAWWLNVVAPGKWKEITITDGDEICGKMPYCISSNGRIGMPPLTQTLGPWLKENGTNSSKRLSSIKECINRILDQIPDAGFIEIALDPGMDYFLPFKWRGFSVTPSVTYQIKNLNDLNGVYGGFDSIVKKNIKSAAKKVRVIEDIDTVNLFSMLECTFQAQGRRYPFSNELVSAIYSAAKEHSAAKILTAVDEHGNIHASSMFVYDSRTCYYLISGSNPEFRASGAQTLILWEAIQFAATVSRTFDFEGSAIEGIETFFRHFGGVPQIYYVISKRNLLWDLLYCVKPKIKKLLKYK